MNGCRAFVSSESIITQCAFNTVYAHRHCITVKRQTKNINRELLVHHLAARENLCSLWRQSLHCLMRTAIDSICLAVYRTLVWPCLNESHVEKEADSVVAINKSI